MIYMPITIMIFIVLIVAVAKISYLCARAHRGPKSKSKPPVLVEQPQETAGPYRTSECVVDTPGCECAVRPYIWEVSDEELFAEVRARGRRLIPVSLEESESLVERSDAHWLSVRRPVPHTKVRK